MAVDESARWFEVRWKQRRRPDIKFRATAGRCAFLNHCLLLSLILLASGCASQNFAKLRTMPINPLANQLNLSSKSGPQVSERTRTLLRHYALEDLYKEKPRECLQQLQELSLAEKGGEKIYAVAELAYILGIRDERAGKEAEALDMLSVGVSHAYMYLFCQELDVNRNPYDPQFRGACDVYNGALEQTLRIISRNGQLKPGNSYTITSNGAQQNIAVHAIGSWHEDDFEHLDFCSDWEVEGLDTSNVTYGIGVPLIAVRKKHEGEDPAEKNYPDGLSFPVTALLRVKDLNLQTYNSSKFRYPCVLELLDPLTSNDIFLNGRRVPLQTDLSTPLAYFLDNPKFREQTDSTLGLLNPAKTSELRGIYMLEPFDPKRIPVLMVHGLWSSPLTWMPMFNDLRSFPELRRNYQFWFYQYPTGQPFWISATQMRQDLYELHRRVDPNDQEPMLDRMVLVGHSMGGLVSRMQTLESGDHIWEAIGNKPFDEIRGSREEIERLAAVLYFHPNRSIRRVVTIGTPHRGSDFANDTARWLSRKFIKLPQSITSLGNSLVRQNPELFHDTKLLTVNTSIDSLSPECAIFPAILRAETAPWVKYHNIIGVVPEDGFLNRLSKGSDGVVTIESAKVDGVASEITVVSNHQEVHRIPRSILEVRRILVEHLDETYEEHQLAEGPSTRLLGSNQTTPDTRFEQTPILSQSNSGSSTAKWLPPIVSSGNPSGDVQQASFSEPSTPAPTPVTTSISAAAVLGPDLRSDLPRIELAPAGRRVSGAEVEVP